jgi:hypothetical protein
MNDESADPRQGPIAITWAGQGLMGRLTLDGEFWAAVEWSEERQQWCIEDAEGRCLLHRGSIHGAEASREAAAALAEAMIRDGRMPDPKTLREKREKRLRIGRERREKLRRKPEEIRKREEKAALLRRWSDAKTIEWKASELEDAAPPLYEVLADAFDFADPELWKSNSFASMRPRLILHVRATIAKLESKIAWELQSVPLSASKKHREATASVVGNLEAKLARAREILGRLAPDGGDKAIS